ncbi:SDR family oxidoreductase (plasmid) [Azospirillum sp. 412522]|nr:SDR family NAD(P)-dependent oxidoreductase [Azospirillum sp. 412522]MBY6266524.1 SDR family oxidoreductase [Azospirillum sp. 412522]
MSLSRLDGRTALVTGSSRGIGRATAECLAAHGADVVLNGLGPAEELDGLAAAIARRHGVRCIAVPADMASPEAVGGLLKAAYRAMGRLDVLVCNAGILGDGRLGMLPAAEVDRVLAVNVAGTLHAIQTGARLMQRGGGGSIVTLASIVGRRGNAGQALYAASKAALIGLTLSAAKELGPLGIRVNAVAPGFIDTDMTAHLDAGLRERWLRDIALGRFGSAEDVARTVLFLAGDLSAYVTGQVLGVDGGMAM